MPFDTAESLKSTAVYDVVLLLVLFAVLFRLVVWQMLANPKWHRGRGLSQNIQNSILGSAVLIICFYLPMIVLFPTAQWVGFWQVHSAGILFFLGVFVCLMGLKEIGGIRLYFSASGGALAGAGIGHALSGYFWIRDWARPAQFEWFMLCLSLSALLYTELTFLSRNKWEFVPADPK